MKKRKPPSLVPLSNFSARLGASPSYATALRKADMNQATAGRLLSEASVACIASSTSSLDVEMFNKHVLGLVTLARIHLACAKKLRDGHLFGFIERIMKDGKRKRSR